MFKKLISSIVVICMLLSSLVACSDTSGKVMQMGDVSVESIDVSVDSSAFVADSDYVSENLFRYLYLYFKNYNLDMFKQYEGMGYDITGDKDIKVDDTEAFWNCVYQKDEAGNEITFGQEIFETTVELFEDILALEAVAEKYGYKLPETYGDDFNKAVAEQIVKLNPEIFGDTTEITDSDGKLFKWAKDRWAMQLMSDGISADAWERVFYLYPNVIIKDITTQLEEKGVVNAEEDSVLIEKGEKELREKLDNFMKTSMKVKYIAYQLKAEDDADDSSKSPKLSSEDASNDADSKDTTSDDVTSDDVSTDDSSGETSEELSPQEYNEQLREKCKGIYEGLVNGSLNIDDEIKKCDISQIAEQYPDGIVGSFDDMKNTFGESTKDLKVGDIKMYEYGGAIHIIQVQELTEKDSGISTELSEDDIEALRAQSVSADLEKLLGVYKKAITKDEALLEKYKKPWNIN